MTGLSTRQVRGRARQWTMSRARPRSGCWHWRLLAKATAALVITYCLGSVIGPLVIGGAMDWLGPGGFIAGMAATSLLLTVVVVTRLRSERF